MGRGAIVPKCSKYFMESKGTDEKKRRMLYFSTVLAKELASNEWPPKAPKAPPD